MTPPKNEAPLGKANCLLALQFFCDIGDQITYALLALSILDMSQSTKGVGLIYFIEVFGLIIFTFIGGVLGDRYSRRQILVYSDLCRGVVVLMMIAAFHYHSIALIYATAFALAILGAVHAPANMSAWAQYVPTTHLRRYNSLSQTVKHGTTIFGPFLAGLFMQQKWTSIGFLIDALTFFVCAVAFSKIVVDNTVVLKSNTIERPHILSGFSIIFRHISLKRYIAYDAIQMLSFGAFNATFLVLAQRDFGWNKIDYSYHLSIVACFTFFGGALGATNFVARINDARKLILCSLISAIAYLAMLHIKSFPTSSLLIGICDGLAIMTISVTRTKTQLIGSKSFPNSLASIMAARRVIISFVTLLGTLSCLMFDNFIRLETTFKIMVLPLFISIIPIAVKLKPSSSSAQNSASLVKIKR